MRASRGFAGGLLACAVLASPQALAVTATTTSITCSPTAQLQGKIDAVAPGTFATILVTGTCNENIVIPQGKTITIVGAAATASITPKNILLPAVTSRGDTTLRKLKVTNATGSAETLVRTDRNGSLDIVSSDLSAPFVDTVVAIWYGESLVVNSRIIGGSSALDVWGASTLTIKGDPLFPTGPTGIFETYVKSANTAVSCNTGGTLRLKTEINGAATGYLTIEKSQIGVVADLCNLSANNGAALSANFRIRGNHIGLDLAGSRGIITNADIINNTSTGLAVDASDLRLFRSRVTGNGVGLRASQGRVKLSAVTASNVSQDLSGDMASSIRLSSEVGASALPKAPGWTSSFACQNGSRFDIDAGGLSTVLGTKYDFLTCLYAH